MTRTSLLALFFCGVSVALPASGERLRSPWDSTKTVPTDAPYNCPEPPAFSRTLDLPDYYIDSKHSIIDEKKLAAFQEGSEGPTHLGQYAGLAADAWLSKGSRAAATCAYSLLTAAAKADAWEDKMPKNTDVYMQKWVLGGTALAYLKVRGSGVGTAEQDALIQKWFELLAARVREYFDSGRKNPETDAWSNHMYWAGLAVAAVGIANNDQASFLWGLSTYEMGIHAIQPDGTLDMEMGRGRMALHYQLYALEALVMLAELGEANGIDLYAEREGAIHRLVKFDVAR
jgi:poly(beta-D-mannuronate) lyase